MSDKIVRLRAAETSETQLQELRAAAAELIQRGYRVVRLGVGSKKFTRAGLEDDTLTLENLDAKLNAPFNIGVRLGEESRSLVDLDLDWDVARRLADEVLGVFGSLPSFGRDAHHDPGHRLVIAEGATSFKFELPKGVDASLLPAEHAACVVEIRASGHTVFPLSTYDNGDQCIWRENGDPPNVDAVELRRRMGVLAFLSVLLQMYPSSGARDDVCMAVAGALCGAGFEANHVDSWIALCAQLAGDEEWRTRAKAERTKQQQDGGGATTGVSRFCELLGLPEACKKTFRKWLNPEGGPYKASSGFICDSKHRIIRDSAHNVRVAIEKLGLQLSFNEMSGDGEIVGLPGYGPRFDEGALTRMWIRIEEEFAFLPRKALAHDVAMDLARERRFHPVREYLDALAWDGVARVDEWLSTYLGAAHTPLNAVFGAKFLIAAVRRVRKPGAKFDEIIVLEGEQGSRKSTSLRVLARRPEFFTDDVPLNKESKQMLEQLSGVWIAEISELATLAKAQVEHVKSLLSQQEDSARLAYDKLKTTRPRCFVFVGTTNHDTYLEDLTGNRRFWPVKTGKIDVQALERDADQLWAEASQREAKGEEIHLPEDLYEAARAVQGARVSEDPWLAEIGSVLGDLNGKISTSDLLRIINKAVERRTTHDNRRLAIVMKALGFRKDKQRFGGAVQNCYTRGEFAKGETAPRIVVEVTATEPGLPPKATARSEGGAW